MASYTGHGSPRLPQRIIDGLRLRGIARLERALTVDDGSGPPLTFRVRNVHEYTRATNALHNEPGTLRWIADHVRSGDVFYDVGANIGIFSLLAAHRCGADGHVIAFEPHAATIATLLENIALNGMGQRADVLSCALHRTTGHLPFLYRSLVAGSGLSQVGATRDPFGHDAEPVARELKAVASVDDLIASGTVRPADIVKIDVDGNETAVLAGMRGLMTASWRPRSIQVEVNPEGSRELFELMAGMGYRETARHRTLGVERLIGGGADPATLGANVVFEPVRERASSRAILGDSRVGSRERSFERSFDVTDTSRTTAPDTAAHGDPTHPTEREHAAAPVAAVGSTRRRGPEVVHRPPRGPAPRRVPLRTHLGLAGHFGHNYVKKYYLDTFLGLLWIPLRPLADVLLRSVLFGAFLQVSSGESPYLLFLVVGSIGWFFFERVTYWGYRSLQYNYRYFRAIPVPWLPAITGTAVPGAVQVLLYALIALGVAVYYAIARGTFYLTLGPETLYALLGLLLMLLYGWMLGLFLAPLVRVARDVRLFVPYPLMFLYVLTPVVYTVDSMPEQYQAIAVYNPLTAPIEFIRHGLLDMGLPAQASILTSAGLLAFTFPVALLLFARAERASHARL